MTIEKINLSPLEKRLSLKDKVEKAKASLKAKGLIHNEILGWATPLEINTCVKEKIITFKNNHYCIPMEQKMIARDGSGKLLRNPIKEWVVSHKFYEYMIKTGRMKDANY